MNAHCAWRNVTGTWPQSVAYGLTATSHGIMVAPGDYWCGDLCTGFPTSGADAYFANPATLARKRIPAGRSASLTRPSSLSSGGRERDHRRQHGVRPRRLAWSRHSGDMAMYDPATKRWTTLPATPGHPMITATPVWTGTKLLTLTTSGLAARLFHR